MKTRRYVLSGSDLAKAIAGHLQLDSNTFETINVETVVNGCVVSVEYEERDQTPRPTDARLLQSQAIVSQLNALNRCQIKCETVYNLAPEERSAIAGWCALEMLNRREETGATEPKPPIVEFLVKHATNVSVP